MKQLVKRAMKRDTEAFMTLIELNTQSMYKVAWSILRNDQDAADAIQDTILACFEKIHTLRESSYFKTWMTRILINNCYSIINNRKRECSMDDFPELPATESQESYFEFMDLLNCIDEKYRLIIVLYYVNGFKISEISKLVNLNENTVKTRLARGRKCLKKEYKINSTQIKEVHVV